MVLELATYNRLYRAIVDILDQDLINVVATVEMLMNKQIYSDSFLKVYSGANEVLFWRINRRF